jgi:ABC-2 type transport system ATP-binding protein
MNAQVLLSARALTKQYGTVTALHHVSFELARGEVVGFLGPNGAGKSTTMKLLTGYLAPSSGTALINGADLASAPLACRQAIGYLPEELPLYLDMRVEAYLDHVARLKGIGSSRRRAEVVEAIESAHLVENGKRFIRQLSKGNRQRVGLAQALLGAPPILILDEPTSGLDPSQVANFRELIKRLSQRHGILLSTHILSEVEASCSRAIFIHRGRTISDESIDHLRKRTTQGALIIRVRSGDATSLAQAMLAEGFNATVDGDRVHTTLADDRRDQVARLAESHGGLRELIESRHSLEDVFRDLTAADKATSGGFTPARGTGDEKSPDSDPKSA